ncbi:Glu/Leu/Phe/Val family dehydrogenase [Zhongshania sp. BJYM1]|uniref:Glu/Leu/Phe/Val family dehydrogenase n=1 Tax=Zhongshania aquatica TaxID=2965069 RepID=UPI0022B2DD26|nr:Glu/Leu/Phe/Val dehydrogenase dimerization domain-containing protein [Marortus sp. BJYM1]
MTVFNSQHYDGHELVSFKHDARSGLRAIVAVHNSNLGPALGGCRMYPYANDDDALDDVLRLSKGMTYKSALAGLPLGGGKAVIIGDPAKLKSRELLLAMGSFIDDLGGRYITAEDSGTSVSDLKIIAERTSYVSGVMDSGRFGGDPSPYTAQGVYFGIKAALKFKHGSDDLTSVRVAVQGAGAVGRHLIALLTAAGATVFAADINTTNKDLARQAGATIIACDEVLGFAADVLAPCAMGAAINAETVEEIQAGIVAGAANNQLAGATQGERLMERGILYAPDFVINAGGIIDVYYQRAEDSSASTSAHVETIAVTLSEIFKRAVTSGVSTATMAECLAEEKFLLGRRVRAA